MNLTRINKIKGNVEIYASKRSTNILDGSYKSIYRGRSLDFDNLRNYIVGDNIKDIDWKSSIRSGNLLVRQYVAEKKHNILLVFDSTPEMLGSTPSKETKYEIASLAAGTLAYLAIKNGDFVASIWQNHNSVRRDAYTFLPYKDSLLQVEQLMTFYEDYMSDYEKARAEDKTSKKKRRKEPPVGYNSINETLDYILRFIRRRSVIFVFTDLQKMHNINIPTLKSLIVSNDVLFVNIKDASVTTPKGFDLETEKALPPFLENHPTVKKLEENMIQEYYATAERDLKRLRISSTTLNDSATITPSIIDLLERHRYAFIR